METKTGDKIPLNNNLKYEDAVEKVLLMEYNEVLDVTRPYFDYSEKRLQFYISILSLGLGILILFQEKNFVQYQTSYTYFGILGIILLVGLINYANLVTFDLYLIVRSRQREKLRSLLLASDREAQQVLEEDALRGEDPLEFETWSSLQHLIGRAVRFGGAKTLIGVGNSLIVGLLAVVIVRVISPMGLFSIPVLIGSILGFLLSLVLHLGYARLRYSLASPSNVK